MANTPHQQQVKGGARESLSYACQKQLHLSDKSCEKCFDFECACDPACMWTCYNQLRDPFETIREMRAQRFTGNIPHSQHPIHHWSPPFLFFLVTHLPTPGWKILSVLEKKLMVVAVGSPMNVTCNINMYHQKKRNKKVNTFSN